MLESVSADEAMRRVWRDVAETAPLSHEQHEASGEIIHDLLRRYAEPHRSYHTIDHIAWVVRRLYELIDATSDPVDRGALIVAALFHDAIYATAPAASTTSTTSATSAASNEAQSAQLAAAQLARIGWPATRIALVVELIEATETHAAASLAQALLLDADLAVLGGDADAYQAYVRGVRAEYAHVHEEQWRVGRAAVLRGFIARPRIFATDAMVSQREAQARVNMAAELAALERS